MLIEKCGNSYIDGGVESLTSDAFMPFVEIHYLEGRTQEQKERLAKAITDAVTKIFEVPEEAVWIEFDEMAKTDFAVGGVPKSRK